MTATSPFLNRPCRSLAEAMAERKPRIITSHVYPPIPIRSFDWSAHYEGEEDIGMKIGWGTTEAEAIEDLVENHPREG